MSEKKNDIDMIWNKKEGIVSEGGSSLKDWDTTNQLDIVTTTLNKHMVFFRNWLEWVI